MTSYWQRFLSKAPALVLLALLIVIFASLILFNIFLLNSKDRLEKNLSDFLNCDTQIRKLFFLPPNFIFLRDVSVFDKTAILEDKPTIHIRLIHCEFSLAAIIFKRSLIISYIYMNRPETEIINLAKLIRNNIYRKVKSDFTMFKKGVRIRIKSAHLNFYQQDKKHTRGVIFDTDFKIGRSRDITGSGNIYLDSLSRINPLYCNFTGSSINGELALDSLELKRGKFYAKLWGAFGSNMLRLNGYSSLSGLFENNNQQSPILKIKAKIASVLTRFLRRPHFIFVSDLAPINFNIFDINCLMGLSVDKIDIENLSFNFNNIPIRIRGDILLSAPFLLNFSASSYPDQPEEFRSINPKRFDLKFKGILHEDSMSGKVGLEFFKKMGDGKFEQTINVYFNELSIHPVLEDHSEDYFKIFYDKMNISYMVGNNLYNISINDFVALINPKDRSFQFDSILFDGNLSGEGKVNLTGTGFKNYFSLLIKNVSANKLSSVSYYFSNVYGSLNSNVYYTNYPDTSLTGTIVIDNGYLDNLDFFVWLADFFKIPNLATINFNHVTAQFFINEKFTRLERIQLDSNDVVLGGYFNLGADNLVSSILSLGLSKEVLQTSSKFRPLMRLLEKDVQFLNFEFQLSGLFSSMNFKWLESNFKQKLQELLPRRLEKQIQEEIEKITQPVFEKPPL